jgi:hypothetical protein
VRFLTALFFRGKQFFFFSKMADFAPDSAEMAIFYQQK